MKYSYNLIVALDNKNGISKDNKIPWYIKEDLKFFKQKTLNNIVLMGRETYDSLPDNYKPLKNRFNIVLTRNEELLKNNHNINNLYYFNFEKELNNTLAIKNIDIDNKYKYLHYFNEIKNLLINKRDLLNELNILENIYIIGGEYIYKLFLEMFKITEEDNKIDNIFITQIKKNYNCDKFFPFLTNDYYLLNYSDNNYSENENCNYRFLQYIKKNNNSILKDSEEDYLSIAKNIINRNKNNLTRNDRTGVGITSIFGTQIRYNISEFIPMLTTKKVAFKACIEELLWFLRGDTDNSILQNKKIRIWDGNSSKDYLNKIGLSHLEENDCGACYGFQWRHFGAEYKDCKTDYENKGVDQVKYVLNLLKNDPYSRRIFLSAWNPSDLNKTCLPPCHVSIQFFVEEIDGIKHLSGHMYQRSADWFLGEPFNILSYTALIYLFAEICDMTPYELIISTGDTHIYLNHIKQMEEQINRTVLVKPILEINPDVKNKKIEEIQFEDFELIGYQSHLPIKGTMAV